MGERVVRVVFHSSQPFWSWDPFAALIMTVNSKELVFGVCVFITVSIIRN